VKPALRIKGDHPVSAVSDLLAGTNKICIAIDKPRDQPGAG
jgi:hypothetical protein